MNSQEILKFCLEKGLLLDGEVLELLSETNDLESIKLIIEKIKRYTGTRVITRSLFNENKEKVNRVFLDLPEESRKQKGGRKMLKGRASRTCRISTLFLLGLSALSFFVPSLLMMLSYPYLCFFMVVCSLL